MLIRLFSKKKNFENNDLLKEISTSSECNPHFLEAYNNVLGKDFEKKNEKKSENNKTLNDNIIYKYIHPGVYREFTFIEKIKKVRFDLTGQAITQIIPKKVSESFWSCCMNSDPNSKGCQKKTYKKFKWDYD